MSAANGRILRLVKNGPEREALDSGQVDAVFDRTSGTALLCGRATHIPGYRPKNRARWADVPGYQRVRPR